MKRISNHSEQRLFREEILCFILVKFRMQWACVQNLFRGMIETEMEEAHDTEDINH